MSFVSILPNMACASAIAAGLSHIATEQFTWNRIITLVKIPAPMTCAKFTAAAVVALTIHEKLVKNSIEQAPRKKQITNLTLTGVVLYGLHVYFNPDKSFRTFAILSVLTGISAFATPYIVDNTNANNIVASVTQNLPKSIAAAGISWLVAKQAGFDPQIMLMTTLFQSVVYYATKPLDNINSKPIGFAVRVLSTLGVTMAYRSAFNITTPLYEPFIKTSAISALAMGGFELLESHLI